MSAAAWTGLVAAWVAAIASPGPDLFLLLRLAVRERRAAVLAAIGIMAGNTIWISVSVFGLSALLAALPWLTPILQILGAAVLIWMGAQALRGGVKALRSRHPETERGRDAAPHAFLLGFTTNIANPKALIFFTALLSQFFPPSVPLGSRSIAIVLLIVIGLVWFVGVAIACSAGVVRRWFTRVVPWFDVVAGCVFILVAFAVLAELALAR